MKKYSIASLLIVIILISGCSGSASNSNSSKKTKQTDNTAYAKKKLKELCKKIDTSILVKDRRVATNSNLDTVKVTHRQTIAFYKLIEKAFADIAKNEKDDLLKPKVDAFVKNLKVMNKQYPEFAKLTVEMYEATKYTYVPTESGSFPITKEEVDNLTEVVKRNLVLLEPVESDININEREFWRHVNKYYPYSCFAKDVRLTAL